MAEYADREHYIPLRRSDLVALLCADKGLPVEQREPFRQFCRLAGAVFHFEYQQRLEELKDAYAPFDPDSETKPPAPLPPGERAARMGAVFEQFGLLMERANFKRLGVEEIRQAIAATSGEWGLLMDVDLGLFERLDVYVRGEGVGTRHRRSWRRLWRLEELRVPVYHRLVVIAKLRPHRRLDRDVDTDAVYLKVFKDVPKRDVDMLMPGARVRMTRLDRALIGYPLAAGVGLLLWNIGANLREVTVGALGSLASWSLALALGGYGYRSYHSYQVKKQHYTLRLTRSLYFQSLDNNAGVLMRLLDEAEEQECRETYLAYFCLWRYAPPEGWTAAMLDDYVELYLEGAAGLKVDFEIGDALDKLQRLRVVTKEGGRFRAAPLEKALEVLDYQWDNYFKYHNPQPEEFPAV
jgi:hypothetical protein